MDKKEFLKVVQGKKMHNLRPSKVVLAPFEGKEVIVFCRIQKFGKSNIYKENARHCRTICIDNVKVVCEGKECYIDHIWIDDDTSPKLKGKYFNDKCLHLKARVKAVEKVANSVRTNREMTIFELAFYNMYKEIGNDTIYSDFYLIDCELI